MPSARGSSYHGARDVLTPFYTPCRNGKVERIIQTLKREWGPRPHLDQLSRAGRSMQSTTTGTGHTAHLETGRRSAVHYIRGARLPPG